jgi:hypothetical protein
METSVHNVPHRSLDPLDVLVARCEAERGMHMTGGGCSEAELRCVEASLRGPLPGPLRSFLCRMGGGVFFLKHEIFGARRVMIHDIELVPDLLSFRAWLGSAVPPDLLPFHRADGQIHAIELGEGRGGVRALNGAGTNYADFTTFLQRVVLP